MTPDDFLERENRLNSIRESRSHTFIVQEVMTFEVVDGYGRRYLSEPAGEVTITLENNGRRIFVEHTADTSHLFPEETIPASRKPASRLRQLIQNLQDWWAMQTYKRGRYKGLNGGQDD